jgi:methyl-accepting chemotaxis protein
MKFFNKMNVGARILIGFVFALVLTIVISSMSLELANSMDGSIQKLANVNGLDTQLTGEIIRQSYRLQISANRYILTQNDKDLQVYSDDAALMKNLFTEAEQGIKQEARLKMVQLVKNDFVEFNGSFIAIQKIVANRKLVQDSVLMLKGPEAAAKLDEVVVILEKAKQESAKAASATPSAKTATPATSTPSSPTKPAPSPAEALLAATKAKAAFEEARLAAYQFIYEGDQAQYTVFEKSYGKFLLAVGDVRKYYPNDETNAKLFEAQGAALEFLTGFHGINETFGQQNRLIINKLNVTGPRLISHALDIQEDIALEFSQSRRIATQSVASGRWMIFGSIAGVTLLISIIAFLIIRSITNPLRKIANASAHMAEGNLDQHLDTSSQDEIGQMAQTFMRMVTYQKGMADIARRIASGDLTVKLQPKSEHDELGHAFVDMVAGLRDLVSALLASAANLNSAAGQLSAAAGESSRATSQIAATIQQVSNGISNQTEAVNATVGSIVKMSHSIDGIALGASEQAQAVNGASSQTNSLTEAIRGIQKTAQAGAAGAANAAETARNGSHTVKQTIQGMQTIREKVGQSSQKVEEMGKRSEQIGSIVETISDIASQTNLLALNAAIEAARAGEHGKGFAVVADEVRKLAEKSATATKEISRLIKGIQVTVAEAVHSMNEGAAEVEEGVRRAGLSGKALDSILDAVANVNQQVDTIANSAGNMSGSAGKLDEAMDHVSAVVELNSAASQKMTTETAEVSQSIENIAAISEENNAAVEEVAASTEEMSAQVEEMTAAAVSLVEMASDLEELVNRFRLTSVETDEPPANADLSRDVEIEANPMVELSFVGVSESGAD